jgi:steroid 5-alpha reductase family enzyme
MTALLLINLGLAFALFVALWAICLKTRDPSVVDSFWAFGMVILAWASWVQTDGSPQRKTWLVGLCSVWGLRLGFYLFWRWRAHGADRRYVAMMAKAKEKQGWGYPRASFVKVFALQAPLLWLVSLPVQVGQYAADPADIGALGWAGVALAVIGIGFESIGDAQLVAFKADPANVGRVMDRGLWRYTRHPNYFGDACLWWGLWLLAAETAPGRWTVIGPALLTFLLMRWSGVPILERKLAKTRPGYGEYVRRTSGFVPWWPKA